MSFAYESIKNSKFSYKLNDLIVFFDDMSCLDVIQAVLDAEGVFAKPFELFSIDGTRFCHEFDECVK